MYHILFSVGFSQCYLVILEKDEKHSCTFSGALTEFFHADADSYIPPLPGTWYFSSSSLWYAYMFIGCRSENTQVVGLLYLIF